MPPQPKRESRTNPTGKFRKLNNNKSWKADMSYVDEV